MDQLTNALAFANCSMLEEKKELLFNWGTNQTQELDEVKTQYSQALLGASFVLVVAICGFSVYAFYHSHRFHVQVRAEIARLGTLFPSMFILNMNETRQRGQRPQIHGHYGRPDEILLDLVCLFVVFRPRKDNGKENSARRLGHVPSPTTDCDHGTERSRNVLSCCLFG